MIDDRLFDYSHCDIEDSERSCRKPGGKGFPSCPTLLQKELAEASSEEYTNESVAQFALQASIH